MQRSSDKKESDTIESALFDEWNTQKEIARNQAKAFIPEKIEEIKDKLKNLPDGRYSKGLLTKMEIKLDCNLSRVTSPEKKNECSLYIPFKVDVPPNKSYRLGEGSYGKVKLFVNIGTGEIFQGKVYGCNERSARRKTIDEKLALSKSRAEHDAKYTNKVRGAHTAVVLLKEITSDEKDKNKETPCMVLQPYIPGKDLHDVLSDGIDGIGKPLTIQQRFDVGLKILLSVQALIEKNLLHRDLKPENIIFFIDDHGKITITISDFDTMQEFEEKKREIIDEQVVTTRSFVAPEILEPASENNPRKYTEKTEVFSLGILFHELFFIGSHGGYKLPTGRKFLHYTWENIAERASLQALLIKMTASTPSERITLEKAIQLFRAQKEAHENRFSQDPEKCQLQKERDEKIEAEDIIIRSQIAALLKKLNEKKHQATPEEKTLDSKQPERAKTKDETDQLKAFYLKQSITTIQGYQESVNRNAQDLIKNLDDIIQKVQKIPHRGFVSRIFNKPSDTALQLMACRAAFNDLSEKYQKTMSLRHD